MRNKKMTHTQIVAAIVTLSLAVGAAIWLGVGALRNPRPAKNVDVTPGLNFLKTDAARSPDEVDTVLEEQRNNQTREEYEAKIQAVQSGEVDVWSEFHDYVILGDSRAVGFWYFNYLDKSRVLSDGGHTIRNVADQLPKIKELNPKYLIFCYGLNDVSIGYWATKEEYAAEFKTLLHDLQEELPDTMMIVSSILPARDPAFERSKAWYQIPEYSEEVGKMCQEEGFTFIDNNEICKTYADYWQDDGIHVRPEFYPYWGRNIIEGILRNEMENALA